MLLKVLVCATEYYPHGSGIANVAYCLVEEFEKRGMECTICSTTGPDIKLGSWEMIKKYGGIGLLYYWERVRRYFKGKKKEFDVFWLHNPLFIGKNPFPNSISTIHTTYHGLYKKSGKLHLSPFLRIYYFIFSFIEKFSLRKLSVANQCFTIVSPELRKELVEIGISEDLIHHVSNGVDTKLFKPRNNRSKVREKYGISDDAIVLLCIGRLSVQKQPFKLIDTFSRVQKVKKNCLLIFVGKGPLEEKLKSYVRSRNIENVSFLGYIDEQEKPRTYSCMDAFITSAGYEGQPLTMLEALSSGLPCIVSDLPNLRTIIEESNAGVVINYDDPNAYHEIISFLESDLEICSKNARQYAVEKFGWSQIGGKYLELLRSLIH